MKKIGFIAMSILMAALAFASCGEKEKDYYEITVACQKEASEEGVMKSLIEAYQKENPDVVINIETFSVSGYESYMNGISELEESDPDETPHIIWTSDTTHARWQHYYTDLRPFYERSEETDYSLYYESMLDTASFNGHFKPTKNYKGNFRSDDLDLDSDGLESYNNHSEYGLYFAPRDYNKPTILCNLGLFDDLDADYEEYYKAQNNVKEMPQDYVSTTARLEAIVGGENWDELKDLTDFSQMAAERIRYIVDYATSLGTKGQKVKATWENRTVLDMKLSWEPCYTTILTAMGVEGIVNADGTLNLEDSKETLETLHSYIEGKNVYYSELEDTAFINNNTFMKIVSRPIMVTAINNLKQQQKDYVEKYNRIPLQALSIPTDKIAAGCSGYAINNIYEGKGVTVKGNYRSYADICWDFIKFIITHDGQEVAGETGSNIPVLKSLYSAETNGGVTPAWRKMEGLEHMNQDAWVAGDELKQDWFNIYQATYRIKFRDTIQTFFQNFQRADYNAGGSLDTLISKTNSNYAATKPQDYLR